MVRFDFFAQFDFCRAILKVNVPQTQVHKPWEKIFFCKSNEQYVRSTSIVLNTACAVFPKQQRMCNGNDCLRLESVCYICNQQMLHVILVKLNIVPTFIIEWEPFSCCLFWLPPSPTSDFPWQNILSVMLLLEFFQFALLLVEQLKSLGGVFPVLQWNCPMQCWFLYDDI